MISGFNSDIEFQGTIYHVQTEDKGLDTPIILSLVYSRGEILASKRSPYDDLIAAGFNEGELNDRLQRQHKLIIAAIRAGRIDDLKRMTMKESQKKRSSTAKEKQLDMPLVDLTLDTPKEAPPKEIPKEEKAPPAPVQAPVQASLKESPAPQTVVTPANVPVPDVPVAKDTFAPIPKPADDLVVDIPIDILEEPFFDEVEVVEYGEAEEDTILPSEAVRIITDYVGVEEVDETKLKIRLLGRTTFMSGQDATLDVLVARGGKLGKGVRGAHILVKILGSSFKPQIYHTKADDNGISQVHLQIPHIKGGRAALLIKALYEGEEVELRHVIAQR